jgi:hypothetical protein
MVSSQNVTTKREKGCPFHWSDDNSIVVIFFFLRYRSAYRKNIVIVTLSERVSE